VVRVVPLRRRHIKAVMRIEQQVYPRPWTPAIFQSELAQVGTSRCYVAAFVGNELAGYGGTMYTPDGAHVTNIAVDPRSQRHGIGTRLLLALTRQARLNGCDAMTLEVRVSNVAAQAMYQRFGYAPAGVRQRYYEGVEDAIVMWVHDVDSLDYSARLRDIEADLPGRTEWTEGLG
jgi:ribosomal-protein-alanine N-acetyltransferase